MDLDRNALLQVFLAETQEQLGRTEEALLALEGTPDHPGLVDGIFRDAHTIKGSAVSLGLGALADVANTMEDILERLRAGSLPATTSETTRLLGGVDTLRRMLAGVAQDVGGSEPSGPAARAEPSAPAAPRTLRIEVTRLDRMM